MAKVTRTAERKTSAPHASADEEKCKEKGEKGNEAGLGTAPGEEGSQGFFST